MTQVPLGKVSVTIGIPIDNGMPPRSVMSLVHTTNRLTAMGIPFNVFMEVSGVVQIGRDMVFDDFLRSDMDKLFWIDSDQVWAPDDFLRLLALSTQVDVVAAAYPAKVDGPPTFYAHLMEEAPRGPFGLVEIKGVGLGFAIVDRKVCQQLAENAPKVQDQITGRETAAVFRVDIFEGHRRTEDIAFFADIRALGHRVWLDPMIELGHIGEKEWRGSILDAFKPRAVA